MVWPKALAGGYLDPASPLNWAHPLNYGLLGEWAVIPNPGWRDGNTARDVVRGGKKPGDGTLSNGASWVGRPGGFGSWKFDGTNDIITTGLSPSGAGTFGCWVRLTADGGFTYFLGTVNSFHGLRVPSGRTPSLCDNTTDISSSVSIGSDWARVVGVLDGSTGRIYVNGVERGSSATTNTWGNGPLTIGSRGTGVNSQACLVDGVCYWGRALTAGEVAAEYAESRRGNPDRWRWVPQRTYFLAPEAGVAAGQPPRSMHQYRQRRVMV